MTIRLASGHDAEAIAALYAPYVAQSAVSFEMEPPDAAEMRSRILAGDGLYPWLVWEEDGAIRGYAYAGQFRARRAYRLTVETSAYVAGDCHGRGIGARLYDRLIETLIAQGFTQAIAAVTLPNDASVRLHKRRGFVRAGLYRDVGYKLGEWRSVGLWQRPLAPLTHPAAEPRPVTAVWTG